MKLKWNASALAAATALTSAAHGATVVQQVALQDVAAAAGVLINGQGMPLAQFNPALGTLQSVTLSLENQVLFYPNPTTNFNQTSATYTLGGHFTDMVMIGGIQLAFTYDLLESGTLYGGQFRMVGIGDSQSAQTTILSGFGALIGTGMVNPLSFMTAAVTTHYADPGVQLILAPSAQFVSNGTLTYTYDDGTNPAVPEPASWALMISGFGLTGAAIRRSRERTMSLAYARA